MALEAVSTPEERRKILLFVEVPSMQKENIDGTEEMLKPRL